MRVPMPRDLPLGNGRLLALFDGAYRLREWHYPSIGAENHLLGRACRTGIILDGAAFWFDAPDWNLDLRFEPDTSVTCVTALHDGLGIRIECTDAIDPVRPLVMREFRVHDLRGADRSVRIVLHHDFALLENDLGDTARALADDGFRGVHHYKRRRHFLAVADAPDSDVRASVNARRAHDGRGARAPIDDFAEPESNAVAHGSVDSVMTVRAAKMGTSTPSARVFLAMGTDLAGAREEIRRVRVDEGVEAFLRRCRAHGAASASSADARLADVPSDIATAARRALLVIRTQIDAEGGILAANDSDILDFGRDHYSYVWPRDGALVAYALAEAGDADGARRFFEWSAPLLEAEGCFLQKYNADGSTASTWHPSVRDGRPVLPIQEDETALWVWALAKYVERFGDAPWIAAIGTAVDAACGFFLRHRDPVTHLPLPSWDLWEERWGTHAWTVGSVWGGLMGGAELARLRGRDADAARMEDAATAMKAAMKEWLWHNDLGRYVRLGHRQADGYWHDVTVDAALAGLWLFGMHAPTDPEMISTMNAVEKTLHVKPSGGLARYEDDYYHQVVKGDPEIPGNPWLITTLWIARWRLALGGPEHRGHALDAVRWCLDRGTRSGMLPEQVHPSTRAPLSVSPLTWSHAELLLTALAVGRESR